MYVSKKQQAARFNSAQAMCNASTTKQHSFDHNEHQLSNGNLSLQVVAAECIRCYSAKNTALFVAQ
jgi:hypothetical protein